jgi:hypothetical protein
MKRLLTFCAALTVAAIPAVTGLAGNASFAQGVPVQVPAQAAQAAKVAAAPTPTTSKHAEPGDDKGKHAEPGDDKGKHAEPGDDKGNDQNGKHGSDDGPGHE